MTFRQAKAAPQQTHEKSITCSAAACHVHDNGEPGHRHSVDGSTGKRHP
jgi:hypothetical protein